jgi:hypothetical protein
MDRERRKQLKAIGKAEVQRRSVELKRAMEMANPGPIGSDAWVAGYATGTHREQWLRRKTPLLHAKKLRELFVVMPEHGAGGGPYLGGYLLCLRCDSAIPSAIRRKLLYWRSCECGNVRWRCVLFYWTRFHVADWEEVIPVKLIGRS